MSKYLFIVLALGMFVSGCGFLTPAEKKDSSGQTVIGTDGKPVMVAAGSKYLEGAQEVLKVAGAFPMFGGIATGIASLLGVGVLVSNRVANNRKNALTATVAGVASFSENLDRIKADILTVVSGNDTLSAKLTGLLSSLSIKSVISDTAVKLGIWKYLDGFIQKVDPPKFA